MNIHSIRKPRVLMVAPRYFPYMGGTETHIHEVGRRLVQEGIDVTVLTTMPQTPLPRETQNEGMNIIRVPTMLKGNDLYIAPEMYRIITQGDWDIVHCQGIHTAVPPLAMLAAKNARLPFVTTFHTGGHSSFLRNTVRSAQWRLLRPLLANANHLIGVSHFEANLFRDMLDLPAQNFSVIPNGANLPIVKRNAQQTKNRTLIISIGRLERYKGHQHMISALPQIRAQRPDAQLLILGAGPYEQELRQLAAQMGVAEYVEIRAIPASDRLAMAQTLSEASLVTLLSDYESQGIAVMEALALQRPVLGTHSSGLKELAEQGLIRTIALNSTPEEIATAALQQIERPLIPMPSALQTWDKCAEQVLNVYEGMFSKKLVRAA
jgi:glycosyltransferase involved in cell wall biosynthesis